MTLDTKKPEAVAAFLEKARKRLRAIQDSEHEQRTNEKEDLRFRGKDQWSPEAQRERGGVAGGVAVPQRPMLSIDLIQQPDQLVYNQANKADLGVKLHPAGENSNDELVEVKQDLYRRIQRDGGHKTAMMWAFDRAKRCGRGWYRVIKQYDEDADLTGPGAFDQEIAYERILNQENVYVDPSAQKADFSDAKYLFCVAWVSLEDARRMFPKANIPETGTHDWTGLEQSAPEWVDRNRNEGEGGILIAEYWFKDIQTETLCLLRDGRVVVKTGDYDVPTKDIVQERSRDKVTVYASKMCGLDEFLEEPLDWQGKYFPFIPVIGREQQPVDGKRLWEGIVRPAMDGQRFYNYSASTMVEGMAMEPKAPWVMPEGQDEGYEKEWQQSNIRNFPVLHYKPTTLGDKLIPPPQRAQVDTSKMQLAMMALNEAKGFVQAATAMPAAYLGELRSGASDPQSGKAILALQQQSDAGTSIYMDNLQNITLPYEGRVVLDLMPYIYDRPGRIAQVLGDEDKSRAVMLNAPYVQGENKVPQRVDARPGQPLPAEAKTFNLAEGKYSISVDVGRSYQTRQQEAGDMIGQVLAKAPELMPLIGPTYFASQDWPGAKDVADILEKVRNQQYPFLKDDETEASPDALKQQIAALQQQLQGMGQQLQQAGQIIQTKQVEQQAKVQIAQLQAQIDAGKIEAEKAIAQMNNAAKIEVARISAAKESANQAAAAQEELLATGIKIEADREARHEEMAHERAMGAATGRSVTMSRTRGQDDSAEEGSETNDSTAEERGEQDQPMGGA